MRFYGMSYFELLKIPIKTFWEMSRNVDRIRSVEDRRMFMMLQGSFSEEPGEYISNLNNSIGKVLETDGVKADEEADLGGLSMLRSMMGQPQIPINTGYDQTEEFS